MQTQKDIEARPDGYSRVDCHRHNKKFRFQGGEACEGPTNPINQAWRTQAILHKDAKGRVLDVTYTQFTCPICHAVVYIRRDYYATCDCGFIFNDFNHPFFQDRKGPFKRTESRSWAKFARQMIRPLEA